MFSQELQSYDYLPKRAIVIPIPLHTSRLNWRGFNQSEEIAEIVCNKRHWKLEPNLLVRSKQALPQVKLRAF